MIYRAISKDSDKFVYGSYLYHPKWEKHLIIEPAKDVDGKVINQLTFHLVKGDTVGKQLVVWQRKGCKVRKFYEGDIIDEGDNYPSVIRFGENEEGGYGFYFEEVQTVEGEKQSRRHLINAYTKFPDKTKVIGHAWKYTVEVTIVPTPDGDFICRNEYEVKKVLSNLDRLHPGTGAKTKNESWTIKQLDNSFATNMSVEYFEEAIN